MPMTGLGLGILHTNISPGIRPSRALSLISQAQWEPTTVLGSGMKCLASPNPYSWPTLSSSLLSSIFDVENYEKSGFLRTR